MGFGQTFQRKGDFDIVRRDVVLPRRTGLRIVVASDIHADKDWFPNSAVERVVEAINRVENVDMVVLPGDFVKNKAQDIDWAAPILGDIQYPTFATLGNHDTSSGPRRIVEALEQNSITVLENRALEYTGGAWLVGVSTMWRKFCDVEKALASVPDDATAIVVGHEPRIATMHSEFLHIAGHTHHGQGRLPLIGHQFAKLYYPRYSAPYHKGLYELDDRFVYTTGGLGYTGVSFRLNCPSEIVVIDA